MSRRRIVIALGGNAILRRGEAPTMENQRRNVRAAFGRLDAQCREIITVLVLADPPVPYDEASEQLGRPVGSLGPSRRRCLQKMKSLLDDDQADPHTDHKGAS